MIHNTAVTNVSCQSGCGMLSSLLACLSIVTSVAVRLPEPFLCCRDSHCPSAACPKHKWMVMYICLALSTFQVLFYLGYILLSLWAGMLSRYSDWLWAGLSGDGIPVGRDFLHLPRPALGSTQPPVQLIPGLSRG